MSAAIELDLETLLSWWLQFSEGLPSELAPSQLVSRTRKLLRQRQKPAPYGAYADLDLDQETNGNPGLIQSQVEKISLSMHQQVEVALQTGKEPVGWDVVERAGHLVYVLVTS